MDDSSGDPDNDQITNLEEYLAGTDPNVAEPEPLSYMLTPMIIVGGIFVLVTSSAIMYRKR